jgi:pyrroloquinoline quinone (PQQ) biosynthesis protein C
MNRSVLDRLFTEALREGRLLGHPFYQRWQEGELAVPELTAYAEQYRHFERRRSAIPSSMRFVNSSFE